jgi:hypothetical protein
MTYTEDDLRAVLGELEAGAPDVSDTLAGVDRLRRRRTVRRRTAGLVAVSAVTVALAAGSLAVPDLFRDPAPATPGADAWQVKFTVDVPRLTTVNTIVQSGQQTMDISDPEAGFAIVAVYDAGRYDPTPARAGKPVDVNGKAGFYRADLDRPDTLPDWVDVPSPRGPGVAWEYAPDSWALVFSPPRDLGQPPDMEADLLRLARAVRFEPTPFRMPFTIGYLPGGLRPDRLISANARLSSDPDEILVFVTVELSAVDGRSLTIEASTRNPTLPVGEPVVDRGNVAINLGPFMISLWTSESPDRAIPVPELTRIARSIAMAGDWNDPATWIEAARAIPTG